MHNTVGPVKITYATLEGDQLEELHRALDVEADSTKAQLGRDYPMFIGGEPVDAADQFEDRSPIDTSILVGRFQKGTPDHVNEAVAAARSAYRDWSARPSGERIALVRKFAETIRTHRIELSTIMGYEVGKNRLECMGDVEESAEFLDYYCDQLEENNAFVRRMAALGPGEENLSVLRPYGVWAVISPFNFPMALAAGPTGAAIATGNSVVLKPASDTPLLGLKLHELAEEAGLPSGVLNVVTGSGGSVGQPLVDHTDVVGIVFTGSKEVGMGIIRKNGTRALPRPVIVEMGGKNPALVMPSADLEKASAGVMRSAFGAQGQKCSACSRVYAVREIAGDFVNLLVEKTREIRIGNPMERDVWLGPLINEAAVETYERAVEQARKDGGRILTGGQRLTEDPFGRGYFVEPTVIGGLSLDHPLFAEELFVPITLVGEVDSLEEAVALANRTEYGLTAGIFSEKEEEIADFFDRVEAGVVYANRAAGATTGAWPGINPFGGWKSSGSTGRGAGGPYYVQQFLREQSRVHIS